MYFFSQYLLFIGWVAAALLGIPAVLVMYRFPRRARQLGAIACVTGLLQCAFLTFAPSSPYRFGLDDAAEFRMIAAWCAPAIFSGLVAITGGSILIAQATRNKGLQCARCGYTLIGNESGVCSECGVTIPPAQMARVRTTGAPSYAKQETAAAADHPATDRTKSRGAGRRIILALAVGAPLSAIGFICGALFVHAGDFFLIPYVVLCPFMYLFYTAVGHLPIFLRKSLSEDTSGIQAIVVFCLLQFLYYYLLFGTIDWVRIGGPRRLFSVKARRSKAKWRWPVVLTLAAIIGIGAGVSAYLIRGLPFDSNSWKALSDIQRGRMVDDLIESGRLVGLSPAQVLDLLGPPSEHYLSYRAGDNMLWIELDERGRYNVRPVRTQFATTQPSEPFSSDAWRNRSPADRAGMALTLESQPEFFSSMSYGEIVQLLGLPDANEMFAYHVGRWSRLLFWLEANRVSGVYLQ